MPLLSSAVSDHPRRACLGFARAVGRAVSGKSVAKSPSDVSTWKLPVRNKLQNAPRQLFRLFIPKRTSSTFITWSALALHGGVPTAMDHHSLGKPGSGACEPAIGLFASRKCDNLKWKAVVSFPETNRLLSFSWRKPSCHPAEQSGAQQDPRWSAPDRNQAVDSTQCLKISCRKLESAGRQTNMLWVPGMTV